MRKPQRWQGRKLLKGTLHLQCCWRCEILFHAGMVRLLRWETSPGSWGRAMCQGCWRQGTKSVRSAITDELHWNMWLAKCLTHIPPERHQKVSSTVWSFPVQVRKYSARVRLRLRLLSSLRWLAAGTSTISLLLCAVHCLHKGIRKSLDIEHGVTVEI